jgi:hypothetical protein
VGNLVEEDPEITVDGRDGFAACSSIIWSRTGAVVDTGESENADRGCVFSSSGFPKYRELEVGKGSRMVSSGSMSELLSSLLFQVSSSSSCTA